MKKTLALLFAALLLAGPALAQDGPLDTAPTPSTLDQPPQPLDQSPPDAAPTAPSGPAGADWLQYKNPYAGEQSDITNPHRSAEEITAWGAKAVADALSFPEGSFDTHIREVKPYFWEEEHGKRRLQAVVENGKVKHWGLEPYVFAFIFEPVPFMASTTVLVLMGLSIVTLLLTTLLWPVAAVLRRRYHVAVPPPRQVTWVRSAGGSGIFSAKGIVNFLEVSAQLGILAAPVALLMIAGEFDLSVGSMIGFAGIVLAIPIVVWHWPVWIAILLAFGVSGGIGFINGLLVVRTGLPSFIVTLGGLFMLRGLTLGIMRGITGRTQASGIQDYAKLDWSTSAFSGQVLQTPIRWLADWGIIARRPDGLPSISGIPVSIVWWIVLTAFCTWLLTRTRFGNWIYASGGDATAARNVGVPVARTKITLFVMTALAAALFAVIQVLVTGSADTLRGNQKEFEAIIAAVVGGCLLTGGYGEDELSKAGAYRVYRDAAELHRSLDELGVVIGA